MWAEKKTKWIFKEKYFNQIVYHRELHFLQLHYIIDEVALSNFLSLSTFVPPLVYRTRAIISRSRFEAALVYKPRILSLKNEEFSFLEHKLSAI